MTNWLSKWFDGMSLWDVAKFFIKGIRKGDLNARSSALAFNFFLALFPSVIFLFTLIPYVPLKNFQVELMQVLEAFIPEQAYKAVKDTINDIVHNKRGGVLSLGFLMALYFATNGFNSMINSFNKSYHSAIKRAGWKQQLIATFLTVLIAVLIILAISMLIGHTFITKYIYKHYPVNKATYLFMVDAGKWLIMVSLCFFAISCLYYFGPLRKRKFRFISAGSTFATLLIILTSYIFNFVVSNFVNYNKVYGSIGTLIIMMLYIRFNAMQLLLGYELNASIENARDRLEKQNASKMG